MRMYIDDWKKANVINGEGLDVKLIALDMDGTLLNEHGVLAAESKEALLKAMEQGVHVVIATGRVFSALPQDVVNVPGIEYAITSNGANIIRLEDRETIYSNLIDGSKLDSIMDILEDEPLFFLVNSYTTGFSATVLENIMKMTVLKKYPHGKVQTGEVALPISNSDLVLPCGIYGKWTKE